MGINVADGAGFHVVVIVDPVALGNLDPIRSVNRMNWGVVAIHNEIISNQLTAVNYFVHPAADSVVDGCG